MNMFIHPTFPDDLIYPSSYLRRVKFTQYLFVNKEVRTKDQNTLGIIICTKRRLIACSVGDILEGTWRLDLTGDMVF